MLGVIGAHIGPLLVVALMLCGALLGVAGLTITSYVYVHNRKPPPSIRVDPYRPWGGRSVAGRWLQVERLEERDNRYLFTITDEKNRQILSCVLTIAMLRSLGAWVTLQRSVLLGTVIGDRAAHYERGATNREDSQ